MGSITLSFSTETVSVKDDINPLNSTVQAMAGGVAGYNFGLIDRSYATSAVSGGSGVRHSTNHVWVGGLVGYDQGQIWNSYATGPASVGDQGYAGGFAGSGEIVEEVTSYSTGAVSVTTGTSTIGGFTGEDRGTPAPPNDDYWNLDTSGISDPSKGAGNRANDPGITGQTTAQLQSGLPAGFDPTIWGESPGINNGMPYLLALPPH